MSKSNQKKDKLLGMPHGTAAHRLRKSILFKYVQLARHDNCYRCDKQIQTVEDLSVEHKEPWLKAENPSEAFFDLENIAFSHLDCNIGNRSNSSVVKSHCKRGHEFTEDHTWVESNGHRHCKPCTRARVSAARSIDPNYGR